MSSLSGESRARFVRKMFGRIAGRYDFLNRVMTFGQDHRWRKQAVTRLALKPGARLLDIGAGTGALTFEAQRQHPGVRAVAADSTTEMIAVGRARADGGSTGWVIADALHLPFRENVFDGVVSGFLMRNVGDVELALNEQWRVLRPEGRLVCLETTPPQPGPLLPLISLYLNRIIPTLGRLLARDAEAYHYLPASTQAFLEGELFADRMRSVGFERVDIDRRMAGTIAIHSGTKPMNAS
jgi:demethylmenaquinone methyltransferase/2-methoxy-6-polyprenyl-1,4-benzoquinol methylase